MARIALLAVLALTAVVYWTGLSGPLVFDDVKNLMPVTDWLQGKIGWTAVVFGNESGPFGRPLSMATFLLNTIALGPSFWSLKLGNLLIHLVNGALVYAFFVALVRAGATTRSMSRSAVWMPLLGAAIWLLHPLLLSTVLYVVQRMAMLSTLFMLVAMLAYVHGRIALDAGRRRRALLLLGVAVPLAGVLALFSKENGILLPLLCGVIELFAFQPASGERRERLSQLFVAATIALPIVLGVALVAMQAHVVVNGYENRSFTLEERLLTETRVLWSYLASLALPEGARLGLFHDDYPISHGWLDPATTSLAIVAWLATLALAWRTRRVVPGFALGVSLFLAGHALESSAFPLLIYFEHRNYLPAVGAIWAFLSVAAFAIEALSTRMHNARRIFGGAAVLLVAVLAAATAVRAHAWSDNRTLLEQSLRFHPDSRWLRIALLTDDMNRKTPDADDARAHAGRLLASPDPSTQRLGAVARVMVDCASGAPADPSFVGKMFEGKPEPLEADLLGFFESLADGVESKPCAGLDTSAMADGLVALLDRSTLPAGDLSLWRLRFRGARLYYAAGRTDDALREARKAYDGGTSDPPVALFIAGLLINKGEKQNASELVERVAGRIRTDDYQGQQLVRTYRAHLSNASQ
jgi:protein O-mannosyl-transferase